MSYDIATCWTELCVEREVIDTEDYNLRLDINNRSSVEVRNPMGTSRTFFHVVTQAIGDEALKPDIRPSNDCKEELERVRDDLDLAISYWTGYSSTRVFTQQRLRMEIADNFEDMYNRHRAHDGHPPAKRFATDMAVPISTTAQMKEMTVERILSFTALINADIIRKREVMRLFRAGIMMADVQYFHWYKIYEILRDPNLRIIRQVQNQRNTCIVPGVAPWFLHDAPQPHRHIAENATDAQDNLNQRAVTGDYLSHLKPIIEYYIENC